MPGSIEMQNLDTIPSAEIIMTLREQAEEQNEAVGARFPAANGTQKRLVASPRGTCVLLREDVSENTFHQSLTPSEIASALRE